MYKSTFMKHPGKLQMHWLGAKIVNSITSRSATQLQQIDGMTLLDLVNGTRLNPYKMGQKSCGA